MLSDSVGRRPVRFVARVYCIGIIRFVDVPPEAGRAFSGRHVPVRGTCNGATLVGTLVPRGQGGYRLALNAAVRREAGGVEAGDDVAMSLGPAPPHPIPGVPAELAAALSRVRGGRLAFEAWPPGRRREVLSWLAAAKRPETRARRIALILRRLGLA